MQRVIYNEAGEVIAQGYDHSIVMTRDWGGFGRRFLFSLGYQAMILQIPEYGKTHVAILVSMMQGGFEVSAEYQQDFLVFRDCWNFLINSLRSPPTEEHILQWNEISLSVGFADIFVFDSQGFIEEL